MSLESDKSPHLSKTVSYGTIVTLFAIVATQFISYGKEVEKTNNIQKDVVEVKEKMELFIDKESVKQMLENRDIKIENISEKLESLDERVNKKLDRNEQLMLQLLQRTPKPQ